jgi:hypothetical protein
MSQATHVEIDEEGLRKAAAVLASKLPALQTKSGGENGNGEGWDRELHFFDGGPLTVQYLLVLDALNFCFWPDGELEYEHLAGGLKASLLEDPHCLDAGRLAGIDGAGVRALVRWKRDLPLQDERARLLREVRLKYLFLLHAHMGTHFDLAPLKQPAHVRFQNNNQKRSATASRATLRAAPRRSSLPRAALPQLSRASPRPRSPASATPAFTRAARSSSTSARRYSRPTSTALSAAAVWARSATLAR